MADGGQVERVVVVSACGEHRAIVQSRCLGLTGTDIHIYIHIYIHTYIQTGDNNASRLLASPSGLAMICMCNIGQHGHKDPVVCSHRRATSPVYKGTTTQLT